MLGEKNNISITNMTHLKYTKYQSHFQFLQQHLIIKKIPSNANVNNNNIMGFTH